jgi:propionate CoA-transferase
MGFRPRVSPDLKTMDARLFVPAPMGLAQDVLARPPVERALRLAANKPS